MHDVPSCIVFFRAPSFSSSSFCVFKCPKARLKASSAISHVASTIFDRITAASALLLASSARRALKLLYLPMGLSALGLLSGGYYANKIYRERVGY